MVRNVRGTELDTAIRPIIASGNDYPHDYEIAPHHHARGQLLHGVPGVMTVRTEHGAWVVPPDQAVWIPPHIEHSVRMMGEVETRCVFVDPNHVAGLPEKCQVLSVSPLMRCLIQAAVDLPLDYALTGREGEIMALLLSELRALPVLPLSLPFPADPRLGERCQAFLARPPRASDDRRMGGQPGHEPAHLHAPLQAGMRPELRRLAKAGLPVRGPATSCRRRSGHHHRSRPRL
jgi:hypothetical protein